MYLTGPFAADHNVIAWFNVPSQPSSCAESTVILSVEAIVSELDQSSGMILAVGVVVWHDSRAKGVAPIAGGSRTVCGQSKECTHGPTPGSVPALVRGLSTGNEDYGHRDRRLSSGCRDLVRVDGDGAATLQAFAVNVLDNQHTQ